LWVGQSGNDRLAVCYRCSLERERSLGTIFNGLLSSLTFSVSAAPAPAPVVVAHEQSMGRRWSGGGIAIAVSFIMAVVSLFMPWYDAVVISRNGLSQLGALLILAYIYPLWKAFEGGEINMGWGAWLGAIAIGGTGWYIYHQRVNFFGTTVNFASTGAYCLPRRLDRPQHRHPRVRAVGVGGRTCGNAQVGWYSFRSGMRRKWRTLNVSTVRS
jgi:hypothetical protein